MSEIKLGSWTVPESPISIEYSLVVVEEIRRQVTDGLQKLSRGGIEVGGVLYGTHEGDSVRLLAVRPMACEHARGPAFMLSENDLAALTTQLKASAEDAALEGLVCVGWFLSHTRGSVDLTETDLEIYNSYFPEPWQVTLVVRPGRASSMRAGFFVREFDGAIQRERSYLEFSFPDRLAAVFDRPARAPRVNSERGPIPPIEIGGGAVPVLREYAPAAEAPTFGQEIRIARAGADDAPSGKRWLWLALWAVLLAAGAIFGVRYFMPAPRPEPIQLTVAENNGVLQIAWNTASKPVKSATRGALEIVDGGAPHKIALSTGDLARGTFSYQRTSGDAEVRLSVEQSDGSKVQEASRFLGEAPGSPAAPAEDLQALEQRRDQLEKEVKRLKDENESQADRIQQLDRTVRILQTRLGTK